MQNLEVALGSFPELTERENEVASRLAVGANHKEIASELGISVKTVDTHRNHLLKKLGLRGNVDLARAAIKIGVATNPAVFEAGETVAESVDAAACS